MRKALFLLAFLVVVLTRGGAQVVDFEASQACLGNPTILKSTSTVRDSIVLYLWDFNGDGSFYDAIGDSVTNIFPLAGFQNVGHKIITMNGQSKAIYKQISIGGADADFSFKNACYGSPVSFQNTTMVYSDPVFFYAWDFGDGSAISNEENPVHQYAVAGSYSVSLTVITLGGCSDITDQVLSVDVPPAVSLVFSGDTIFPVGDSVVVAVQGIYDSVVWSTGSKRSNITVYYTGYYWAQVYAGNCSVIMGFNVETREYGDTPEVAALITPNGDGFNDLWEILNLARVGPCEAEVFNKRGERVFSAADYQNDWDGTFKGGLLSNDTYYYAVRCFDNNLYRGTLNILK